MALAGEGGHPDADRRGADEPEHDHPLHRMEPAETVEAGQHRVSGALVGRATEKGCEHPTSLTNRCADADPYHASR